jgi:hypothetical protein
VVVGISLGTETNRGQVHLRLAIDVIDQTGAAAE